MSAANRVLLSARFRLPPILDQAPVGVALALVVAAYLDLASVPTGMLPILYVVPILLAGLVTSPRVVLTVVLLATGLDLIGMLRRPVAGDTRTLMLAVFIAEGVLAYLFARQRAILRRLRAAHTRVADAARIARIAAEREERAQQLLGEATRALHTRDNFLAVAAHELKTPITSLRGFAQLELLRLQRREEIDRQQLGRALHVIDEQSRRLSELVSRLFDVIRIDSGGFEICHQPADLGQLVVDLVATRSPSPQHPIVVDAAPLVVALIDPLRIMQTLTNLLDNAIKFSPNGGTIDVCVRKLSTDAALVAIRDHGLGIPPERRAHLFDRYYQGDPENYRCGLGLGLYLCREIAERHGGTIAAEFPDDGGTRIVLTLPLRFPSSLEAPAPRTL